MDNFQSVSHVLVHWSFGITILIGLVASEFSGGETVAAIAVAAATSTLSAICNCVAKSNTDHPQYRTKRLNNILHFLILWLDILTNLVAASTCARLASATVDYISKGHFREFLFGLQQHSLGEPWPDVLGVTIIIAVTTMFMLGLERSHTIIVLLIVALLGNFIFFTTVGSFHTMIKFWKWCQGFKIHSFRTVLKAASICSFAFVHNLPMTPKNNCFRIFTLVFNPVIFYMSIAVVYSLMTDYRELVGTAIPLIQVFENRDVDWARPILAVFTVSSVCLLLTEILPRVYFSFVKLASKEWQVFVASIQYQSLLTGAPVLAIFAAGSLAAILAFACPLSHLIKLLNTSHLVKCALVSCQILFDRYKPEVSYSDSLGGNNTNVQYRKLKHTPAQMSSRSVKSIFKDKLKALFSKKPSYIHKIGSPKNMNDQEVKEERECLLMDDYSNKSILNVNIQENSESDNDENELEVLSCSEDTDSSTDIDIIVEEYREGLKVATVGNFKQSKWPPTCLTATVVAISLIMIVFASINISLYLYRVIHIYWPDVIAIAICIVLIASMPQNSTDKNINTTILPSVLFPFCHSLSIVFNIVLASTIAVEVWQGIVFWTIAGFLLYVKCDCCVTCESPSPINKRNSHHNLTQSDSFVGDIGDTEISVPEQIFIAR